MRFNVNLASQPYEDAGQFYGRWIPIVVVLAALTITLSAMAISVYNGSRKTDRQIAKIDQRLVNSSGSASRQASFSPDRKTPEREISRSF
jgi:hypothetical protein